MKWIKLPGGEIWYWSSVTAYLLKVWFILFHIAENISNVILWVMAECSLVGVTIVSEKHVACNFMISKNVLDGFLQNVVKMLINVQRVVTQKILMDTRFWFGVAPCSLLGHCGFAHGPIRNKIPEIITDGNLGYRVACYRDPSWGTGFTCQSHCIYY